MASKHLRPQWLSPDETIEHCEKGIGIWKFASDENPEIVLAASGDTPTLEVMAATQLLKTVGIKVRVVNVVDLLKLESLGIEDFKEIFPDNIPVIFNFHGYPSVIKGLTYDRDRDFEIVHGYEEEGSITTPFDMRVINKIDRYHLCMDALFLLGKEDNPLYEYAQNRLFEHKEKIKYDGDEIDGKGT